MKITKQQAREFLEQIKKEDKVAIIHHDDLDGFSSGILFYDFCVKKGCETKHIAQDLEPISKDTKEELKDCNVILITDIPPFFISDYLEEFKDKKILYIDHHQPDTGVSDFIFEYRVYEKYFPASRLVYELVGGKEWLGITGIIADYGFAYKENDEMINSFLGAEKISLENYKNRVVNKISNFLIYFNKEKNKSFEILQKIKSWDGLGEIEGYSIEIEKEIKRLKEDFEKNKEKIGKINFYMFESLFPLKSVVISIVALGNSDEIFIFAENKVETINLSARYQNKMQK